MPDPPRRVAFFHGQVLTAADLAAEQAYHREMRQLHNRRLHGYGTVSGLEVSVTDGCVEVSPGLAIDGLGREVVVTEPLTVCLEAHLDVRRWVRDVVISWHETPEAPVPGPDGTPVFTRWLEHAEVRLVAHDEAGPEDLVLARLTGSRRRAVRVDASVRRHLTRE